MKLIGGWGFFAAGYTLFYWAVNILVDAYLPNNDTPMNPAPLAVLFGLGSPTGAPTSSVTAPRRGVGAALADTNRGLAAGGGHPHNTGGY